MIDYELQLKDLETVDAKLASLKRAVKSGDKDLVKQHDFCEKLKIALESGKSARTVKPEGETEELMMKEIQLLTAKPVLYLCNVDEGSVKEGNAYTKLIEPIAKAEGAEMLIIGTKIEADIAEFETFEERQLFLDELGLAEAGVNRLIRSAYKLLKLQTYFTAGEKEVRAWTVKVGATAPEAAGVIHTDFEKGFIRAEVMKFADFVKLESEQAVKEAGKLKIEGKGYVVEDGDIMHFRFNV